MASLTPGVLSKLIQNIGNTHVKVVGEHRSALLQVIGILPSCPDDDPWKSKGFYLRVSDSLHSAYVSVSESDVELILNDTIQLGQFVHVTRLDSGSPVPVLRGLKPVPKRRPCVGEPKDLISSEALQIKNRIESKTKSKAKPKQSSQKVVEGRRFSIGNGKIEGLDQLRRLSLDQTRKGWDRCQTPTPTKAKNGVAGVKLKPSLTPSLPSTPVRSHRRSLSEKDFPLEQRNSSVTPFKNKNVIVSEKLISKPIKKDLKSSFEGSIPSQFTKVPVSYKSWRDTNISWDSVPPKIQNLGKEVIYHRNVGFFTAVHALEESSASEGILHCMSVFAEMCESAQQDCTNPLVEPFLNLYQGIQKAADAINSLESISEDRSRNLLVESPVLDTSKSFKNKSAALWVQAAIDTDLSMFSLFKNEDQNDLSKGEKTHFIVLENSPQKKHEGVLPEKKQSPKNLGAVVSYSGPKTLPLRNRQRVPTTKKLAVERVKWSKGQGLKDASRLADKLLTVSRAWFLNYLEVSLKNEFGLKKGEGDSEITGLLGQLKRVNDWLDESVGNGSQMDERVECLRKELYKFLLDHVDSAIVQTS